MQEGCLLPLGGCRGPGCFPSQVWRRSWEKISSPEKSPKGRLLQGTVEGCSHSKALGGDGGKSTSALPASDCLLQGQCLQGLEEGGLDPAVCADRRPCPSSSWARRTWMPTLDLCNPARSSPVLPSRAWPGSRQGAGCCSRTTAGTGLTGRLPAPFPGGQGWSSPPCPCDCSDTLAQGSFHAEASFSASASHSL